MKFCFVKQEVYQDLYIADNSMSPIDILFSSMMRVGPFSLINDLNADFFIIKEENTEECQIYNHFLKGFGGNYNLLKTQTLNTIPGNQFFIPGSDKPNGFFSVNQSDIDWNLYDIVISINFSIPTNIIKNYPNTLWCYLIGENNLHLLNEPKYSYDIALNQDINISTVDYESKIVQFPYTFLSKDTLYKSMNSFLQDSNKNAIYVEINSCRGRPVSSYPNIFDKVSSKFNLPILLHDQNIKQNLINLYNSKYFIKFGGRSIRGNSVIEAISSSTLVLMDPTQTGYGFLISDECTIKNEQDIINKLEYFQNDITKYADAVKYQKTLLDKFCFQQPIDHIFYQWYKKMNTAIVFVSNLAYFGNFNNSLMQLIKTGKYTGKIILLAADDLYNTHYLNDNQNIKLYNIEVIHFPDIKTIMKKDTVNKLIKHLGEGGKKNYNWCFGCFNKFYLFHTYFKQYKYILYLDTGIKIYRPIYEMFNLVKHNTILAHHDDYPKYHYDLAAKIRDIEPYKTNLRNEFDLDTKKYFQTTAMLYDTSIIQDSTIDNIINIIDKYPISHNGDQEYISLYFHQVTKQMQQITIKKNDNEYYYDYYQRQGVGRYCITKL